MGMCLRRKSSFIAFPKYYTNTNSAQPRKICVTVLGGPGISATSCACASHFLYWESIPMANHFLLTTVTFQQPPDVSASDGWVGPLVKKFVVTRCY